MTRKTISRGLAIAVVLAGIFGLSRWMRPTPLPSASLTKSKTPPPSKALPASPAPSPPLPDFGTAAFAAIAKERGAAWVGARNRDAVSLLALWDMTDDENVLKEAAGKFPGNPEVCLAMLNHLFQKETATDGEKQQWIEHMIAADPENPLGLLYQARLAFKNDDMAAARAALESAVQKKGRINHYLRERMVAAKEGLLASGVPLQETYLLSMTGPMRKVSEGFSGTGSVAGIFKKELERLKGQTGTPEEKQELAELGLKVAEQQRLTESPTLMTDLIAATWKTKFLTEINPETEMGNTGRNAAQELEIALKAKDQLSKLIKTSSDAHTYLQSAPPEMMGQYADLAMLKGETAALPFLIEAMEKSNR